MGTPTLECPMLLSLGTVYSHPSRADFASHTLRPIAPADIDRFRYTGCVVRRIYSACSEVVKRAHVATDTDAPRGFPRR